MKGVMVPPMPSAVVPGAMARLVDQIGKPEFCGQLPQTASACLDFDNVISLALNISWQTVKVLCKQLCARCGITTQAELFAPLLPKIGADKILEKAEVTYV